MMKNQHNELKTFYSDGLQLVRKQLRITDKKVTIYLLEFEAKPMMRIVLPPSHRYQALAVHTNEHWGVQ